MVFNNNINVEKEEGQQYYINIVFGLADWVLDKCATVLSSNKYLVIR